MIKFTFPLIFLLFCIPAQSQDFIIKDGKPHPTFLGEIKVFKGKVFKKNAAGEKAVEHGERFRTGDLIITGEQSFAKILMVDDSVISIGGKTQFLFENGDFKSPNDRQFIFNLLKGQIVGNIKNKAKPNDLTFKTKLGVMGVRGTYLMMNVQENEELLLCEYALLEGTVDIKTLKGDIIDLSRGDHLKLLGNLSKSASLKSTLTPQELIFYEAREIDESKEFKPFLSFSSFSQLQSGPPFKDLFPQKIDLNVSPDDKFPSPQKIRGIGGKI